MPRGPRRYAESSLYHVFARSNDGRRLFRDDLDRLTLLTLLGQSVERFQLRLFAWCLMGNHTHVVLRVPEPVAVSRALHWLNCMYARAFNRRHARQGHLFRKPYGSTAVESEQQLYASCRYVLRNPVHHGFCDHPEEWRWSSFRSSARLERPRPNLDCAALDEVLGIRSASTALIQMRAFAGAED